MALLKKLAALFQSPGEIALLGGLMFFTYILWMGNSRFHSRGIVGKIHRFLLNLWPPPGYKRFKDWLSQTAIGRACNWFVIRLFYKPNPVFQILYVLLLLGGFYVGAQMVWEHMSFNQKIASHLCIWPTFALFLICSFRDPGVIKATNIEKYTRHYPYDRVIYFANRKCSTCETKKLARSKHCSVCNKCIHRFDHHCPWINNCVGARNILYFLSFTAMTGITCLYATYLLSTVLYHQTIVKYRLIEVMNLPRFKEFAHPYVVLVQLLVHYVGSLYLGLLVLCFFSAIALFGFTGYHLYLVYRNMTTNETSKYSDLRQVFAIYERKRARKIAKGERPPIRATTSTPQAKKPNESEAPKTKAEKEMEEDAILEEMRGDVYMNDKGKITIRNIYNKGLSHNYKELFNHAFEF